MTDLTTRAVEQSIGEDSDVVHLVCCRDDHPAVALCGWLCLEPGYREDGQECVVCGDIADGYPGDACVRGGRCPE